MMIDGVSVSKLWGSGVTEVAQADFGVSPIVGKIDDAGSAYQKDLFRIADSLKDDLSVKDILSINMHLYEMSSKITLVQSISSAIRDGISKLTQN